MGRQLEWHRTGSRKVEAVCAPYSLGCERGVLRVNQFEHWGNIEDKKMCQWLLTAVKGPCAQYSIALCCSQQANATSANSCSMLGFLYTTHSRHSPGDCGCPARMAVFLKSALVEGDSFNCILRLPIFISF